MVFSEEKDLEITTYYKEIKSASKTAKFFGCCSNSVYKILREHNVELYPIAYQRDKYKDSKCFTDFSREGDSYFYGLLLADGCMEDVGNDISISLKETDFYMLEKFKRYLNSENKIIKHSRGNSVWYTFKVGSKSIKERLLSFNFTPNKSTKQQLPSFDWLYNNHFWRGVVDGDGSVFFSNNSPKISLCGSKELLEGFNKFCQLNCFTKSRSLDKTKTKDFFTICYSGEEALSIMRLLYDDSKIHLTRKKDRVEQYKTLFTPQNQNKNIRVLPSGNYSVRIGFDGKKVYVGTFKNYEDALSARLDAEMKYQGKIKNDVKSDSTDKA